MRCERRQRKAAADNDPASHGQLRFAAELMLVIHERLVLSGEKQLADSCFKRDRPIVRLRCVPSPGA